MAARGAENSNRPKRDIRADCEHVFVHPPALHNLIKCATAAGNSDADVAESFGLARTTVRDIRLRPAATNCPRCWTRLRPVVFASGDYAELLGLYLGDGHILRVGRSYRLRISLDTRYAGIIRDTQSLLDRCFPSNAVGTATRDAGSCAVVSVNHLHLPCMFPQHATGSRKHERPLLLERWQDDAVREAPWRFLRGCIVSDGCVFMNRTGRYSYVSYDFSNLSSDLLDIFTQACSLVGVEYRRYARCVRIYRRPSVALMLEHVGTKE